MTSDFNAFNHNQPSTNRDSQPSQAIDAIQRDRFELLSAYLDSEVTAAERRQVEEWLTHDPTMQRLHARLLKLRQGFQNMPVPAPTQSVEQTVEGVFAQVERKPKLTLVWGGGAAIAALFAAAFVGVFGIDRFPVPQIAQSPGQEVESSQPNASEPLLIALDKPLVAIPKAPVSNSAPASNTNSN